MNRELRNLLSLCVGLFLGGFLVINSAHAGVKVQTFNGGERCVGPGGAIVEYPDAQTACDALTPGLLASGQKCSMPSKYYNLISTTDGSCSWECRNSGGGDCSWSYKYTTTTTCPDGYDNVNGECKPKNNCTKSSDHAWYARKIADGAAGSNTGTYCSDGCEVEIALELDSNTEKNGITVYENATYVYQWLARDFTGNTCTSGTGKAPPTTVSDPGEKKKTTPCAEGEGVLSSSTGKLYCVPQNTEPQPQETPKQTKETKTKDYPDGSKETTTTWNTCNGAGACQTITQTTVSNSSSGQPGQAGQPGTTITNSNTSGTGSTGSGSGGNGTDVKNDFCSQNPTAQICKNNIATEATAQETLGEVKKLTTVDAGTSMKGITDTADFSKTPGFGTLKDQSDEIEKRVKGDKKDGEIETKKSAWNEAMASGWFSDLPSAECVAPQIKTRSMPISASFDDWCARAAQISQIGSYCMYMWLLFTVFGMLTGGSSAKGD